MKSYTQFESPLGEMLVTATREGVTGVYFVGQKYDPGIGTDWTQNADLAFLAVARRQLDEYFRGARSRFDVPLAPRGTPFQLRVWRALMEIPFGETRTYGAIAGHLGAPSSSRAVGAAVGRNPISVMVPCHRVVGATGSLTGYAGGLDRKRALLALERTGASRDVPEEFELAAGT
jgi:methylated-DNA-[protein]-cysteine S-methyltransferase